MNHVNRVAGFIKRDLKSGEISPSETEESIRYFYDDLGGYERDSSLGSYSEFRQAVLAKMNGKKKAAKKAKKVVKKKPKPSWLRKLLKRYR